MARRLFMAIFKLGKIGEVDSKPSGQLPLRETCPLTPVAQVPAKSTAITFSHVLSYLLNCTPKSAVGVVARGKIAALGGLRSRQRVRRQTGGIPASGAPAV